MLIMAALVFSLAACGNTNENNNTVTDTQSGQSSDSEQNTPQALTDSTGKAIVVYFSASGNTRRAAEFVADEAGADLFELIPVNPYSAADLNWTDRSSRVCREHDDESLQDIELTATKAPDWEKYDTVFIAYPLWWREAAWPVNNFIKNNDFSGKTVIPFCTSTSNGIGRSGKHLADMAGTGEWLDGTRFSEYESEEAIREWVHSLNLE